MRHNHPYRLGLDKNAANFVALSPLSFIERSALVYSDRLAVIYGTRRQTWAQTHTRCRQLAHDVFSFDRLLFHARRSAFPCRR